jgi:hypothetical protein
MAQVARSEPLLPVKKNDPDGVTDPEVGLLASLTLHSPKACILTAPLHARIPKARPCPIVVSPLQQP